MCAGVRALAAAGVALHVAAASLPAATAAGSGPSAAADPARETGRPVWRQFSYRDYHAHHQGWNAVESTDGLLYFGNKGGVLEFDGAAWRTVAIPGTSFVRGLARTADGTIYVAGVDELGRLVRDADGTTRFVSLLPHVPAELRPLGDVWAAIPAGDDVFFEADQALLRWHDGKFQSWPFPGGRRPELYVVGARVFLHRLGEPLRVWRGGNFEDFADAPALRERRIRGLVELPDGRLLAATPRAGLWAIAADGRVERFATPVDEWAMRQEIYVLERAGDRLYVSSVGDGAMVLGLDGAFLRHLGVADGLRDPLVKSTFAARDGAHWLCLNNGLVELVPPFGRTFFAREHGLDGATSRSIARHGGALYVATGAFVHRLEPADPAANRNARFTRVDGLEGRFYSLLARPDGLLVAEHDRLFWRPDDGGAVQTLLTGPPFVALAASARTRGRVWVLTSDGLMTLDRAGDAWRTTRAPAALAFEARSLAENDDGSLWLGTFTRGVARVRWPALNAEPQVEFFRGAHGLPAGEASYHVARAGDHVFANAGGGPAFRWDPARTAFVAAPLVAAEAGAPAPAEPSAWLVSPGQLGASETVREFRADGTVRTWSFPELLETTGPLQQVFAESGAVGRVLWLAGAEGVGRVDLDAPAPSRPAPTVVLRRARFDGRGDWPAGRALPPGAHRLEFEFSASASARAPEFSTRLDGLESDWSPWTAARTREFSSPPAGAYTLRVRVRDGAQAGAAELAFPFVVGTPWWATWWARAAYALLAAAAVAGLVRWRLAALRRRADALERTVARRTAELQASNEQLSVARDAAEAANRAKSTFLAHMSHELRTPLNGILGYAQILARDPAQPAPARERIRVINDSGRHLLGLINEILDLARVEAGKMPVQPAPCALPALLDGVVELLRAPAEAAGLGFEFAPATELPRLVRTDEQKLRQVLLNLLGNAVKFTPRGRVRLEVAPLPSGRVRFAVSDTGPGIAPDRLATLFQPFNSTASHGAQGTGLGLALSQRMVELLGGRLHVESEVGAGARFWFELPLPEIAGELAPRAAAPRAAPTGYTGPRRRLLVVDDDATNRAVLRDLLAPLDFRVGEAEDTESTLAAVRTQPPDAVLLDLRFRFGDDGFALARRLRADETLRGVKLVAVSASVFESDRHEAIQAGCDDFLPKPFTEAQLFAVLGATLGLQWIEAGAGADPRPGNHAVAGAAADDGTGRGDRGAPNGAAPAGRTPLSDAARAELLELARRGDARRLRARLDELAAAAHPAPEVAALRALAAGFQMKRLREALAAPASAPPTEPNPNPPPSADAPDHPHR